MAGTGERVQRSGRGMSVFWMILILGAVVFLLMAIVLLRSGGEDISEAEAEADQEIVAGEADEVPGTANFEGGEVADEAPQEPGDLAGEAGEINEEAPLDGQSDDTEEAGTVGAVDADPAEDVSVGEDGEAAEGEPAEADPAAEDGGAEPEAETGDESEATDDGADAVGEEAAQPTEEEDAGGTAAADDPAEDAGTEDDIVVDPDGTIAPVDPTPSGPEGRDDEVITE